MGAELLIALAIGGQLVYTEEDATQAKQACELARGVNDQARDDAMAAKDAALAAGVPRDHWMMELGDMAAQDATRHRHDGRVLHKGFGNYVGGDAHYAAGRWNDSVPDHEGATTWYWQSTGEFYTAVDWFEQAEESAGN